MRSLTRGQLLQIKVRLDHEKPEVDSLVSVWPTANWLERETYDLFGIKFTGHPDLRRMLLDDDFVGYPLLKSFHQVPFTVKPPATTQVDPNMAVAGKYQQKGVEHVVRKKLGRASKSACIQAHQPLVTHLKDISMKQTSIVRLNREILSPTSQYPKSESVQCQKLKNAGKCQPEPVPHSRVAQMSRKAPPVLAVCRRLQRGTAAWPVRVQQSPIVAFSLLQSLAPKASFFRLWLP